MKRFRACLVPAILLTAALFATPKANAQYVYGYSLVSLSGSTVYSWSYTELDYVSSGSYSVETDAYPNFASSSSGTGSSSALVGTTGSASPGNSYYVQTNHWVIASGSDPYGFGGIEPEYYGESFSASPTGTPGAGGSFWVGTTWYTAYYGSPPSISEVDGSDYTGYVIIWGTDLTDSSDDTQVAIDGSYVSLAYVSSAQVNAYYSAGVGSHSLSLTTPYGTAYSGFSVNPLPQTIYFYSLSNVTYGAAPFGISASTTSGLPVTFTSNTPGVCTVSGTTVTIVSGGTCLITASQPGNTTYYAAASVTQTLTVIPASQSISFGPLSNATYQTQPLSVSATASSGLPVSFVSNTQTTCSLSGALASLITSGTCSITAIQPGNADFSAAASVTQAFTISPGTGIASGTSPSPQNPPDGPPDTSSASALSATVQTCTDISGTWQDANDSYYSYVLNDSEGSVSGTATLSDPSCQGNVTWAASGSGTNGTYTLAFTSASGTQYCGGNPQTVTVTAGCSSAAITNGHGSQPPHRRRGVARAGHQPNIVEPADNASRLGDHLRHQRKHNHGSR